MKKNALKQRIAAGEAAVGHMVSEFGTRGIAKILETAGIDFVLLDMEHSGIELERIADLLAWLKATPIAPIVRVPAVSYPFIARAMDAGALGIMAPNVQTPEAARAAVDAVKYAPQGRRGLGLGTAHNDYVPPVPADYLEESNRNTAVICQIESVQGLENLDGIAALPGIDLLWVGQFDLTQSMGIVGQFEHPRFLGALAEIAETALRHGKAAGIQPGSAEQAAGWMKLGYSVISLGTDVGIYRSALQAGVAAIRDLAARGR